MYVEPVSVPAFASLQTFTSARRRKNFSGFEYLVVGRLPTWHPLNLTVVDRIEFVYNINPIFAELHV